jgi:hypothetical protein
MGVKPIISTVTVTTAATRVAISSTDLYVSSVYFEALGTNTGYIYIGDSVVSSTAYMTRLAAGVGFAQSIDTTGGKTGVEINLKHYYVDSSVSGEKVQMSYMQRTGSY